MLLLLARPSQVFPSPSISFPHRCSWCCKRRAGLHPQHPLRWPKKASHQLHVLLVGCGMGGLAAAHYLGKATSHKVTLFEAAPAIGEVSVGIQVTPNVSHLLQRLGAGRPLEAVTVRPDAIALRRYDTGEQVGYTRWTNTEAKYGAPYYHIHRTDLHKLLFDLAVPHMALRLNATVVSVDPDAPSLTLAWGGGCAWRPDRRDRRRQQLVAGDRPGTHEPRRPHGRCRIPQCNIFRIASGPRATCHGI